MSCHIQARRKMLAERENCPVPKMPFDQLCSLLADAIKSVLSERVVKTFKQTLLSLPIDGSQDQAEGSKRLLKYIATAPSVDQLPEKHKVHVTFKQNFNSMGLRLTNSEFAGKMLKTR